MPGSVHADFDSTVEKIRVNKWYFGGIAGVGAACCTHPLDLIKVHIQTQQEGKIGIFSQAIRIIRQDGWFALYSGLSGSMLRQITYSTTKFAIYELGKQRLTPKGKKDIPFIQKIALAASGGAIGGMVGNPGDLINVRMQNDIKLPPDKRRKYKHAPDGLIRVTREEGFFRLWCGAPMATSRAIVVTVSQLCTYDQIKIMLLRSGTLEDGFVLHFLSSFTAGAIATFMTQPFDVLKTRQMNAKPGEIRSFWGLITYTARLGCPGFFKGFIPAFIRVGPHTIIMFMIMEQLRKNFGAFKEIEV